MTHGNSRPTNIDCVECGAPFQSRRGQRICSTACRTTRHARRIASVFTRTQRHDIFARDAWQCGICGAQVDPSLSRPDPMSVTVDHIVPVARGGAHSAANAQCAHWLCNARKAAHISAVA